MFYALEQNATACIWVSSDDRLSVAVSTNDYLVVFGLEIVGPAIGPERMWEEANVEIVGAHHPDGSVFDENAVYFHGVELLLISVI